MEQVIAINFAISLTLFVALWGFSVAIKDVSIVDIAWGPACALPAISTWFLQDVSNPRAMVLMALVSLWAFRLFAYLAKRNIGHGEDFRYVRMREKVGPGFVFASLYRVFIMQCVVSFTISLPVQIGQFGASSIFASNPDGLGILAYLGIAVFFVGLAFEAIGDAQLRAFKSDPDNKGKLMDRGLWAWTRHPNYFGDATVWFGLTLIALESQFGVFTIFSPAIMFFFLYHLSGKALLERSMSRRYSDFEDYKKRVSGFFPLPPKTDANG